MKCFLFATLFTALSGAIAEDPSPPVIPSAYTAVSADSTDLTEEVGRGHGLVA